MVASATALMILGIYMAALKNFAPRMPLVKITAINMDRHMVMMPPTSQIITMFFMELIKPALRRILK